MKQFITITTLLLAVFLASCDISNSVESQTISTEAPSEIPTEAPTEIPTEAPTEAPIETVTEEDTLEAYNKAQYELEKKALDAEYVTVKQSLEADWDELLADIGSDVDEWEELLGTIQKNYNSSKKRIEQELNDEYIRHQKQLRYASQYCAMTGMSVSSYTNQENERYKKAREPLEKELSTLKKDFEEKKAMYEETIQTFRNLYDEAALSKQSDLDNLDKDYNSLLQELKNKYSQP